MSGYTCHKPGAISKQDIMDSLEKFVSELLATPGSQVNIERSNGRRRLRYMTVDAATGKAVRKALELSGSDTADALATLIHRRRRERALCFETENEAALLRRYAAAQRQLRKRVLAACPRGRVIRRRLGLVFDIAAKAGTSTLADFIRREPWLARSHRAGRRQGRK